MVVEVSRFVKIVRVYTTRHDTIAVVSCVVDLQSCRVVCVFFFNSSRVRVVFVSCLTKHDPIFFQSKRVKVEPPRMDFP
jgi:hypothetical protein